MMGTVGVDIGGVLAQHTKGKLKELDVVEGAVDGVKCLQRMGWEARP